MKRIIFIILGCINICLAYAQSFNGQYISEWQWDMNKNTNLINQLRLELSVPIGKGKDSFEAATLHVAKTNDGIIDDWQGFSNIDADNNFAMLAVLGYMHEWQAAFLGRRRLPRALSAFELEAFFTFTGAERRAIEQRRTPALQLGLALQLGFLRMSGRPLDAVGA